METKISIASRLVGLVLFVLMGCSQAEGEQAKGRPALPMLSQADINRLYRNCPNGYYSGPQPGKARYTKDNFTWAVSSSFAANFCMRKEFVDIEMRDFDAIAYRMIENDLEETCGWGGDQSNCAKSRTHRLEIYMKQGVLPKKYDFPYFHVAALPSAMLISKTGKEAAFLTKYAKERPRPGTRNPFHSLVLIGKNGDDLLILGTARPYAYFSQVFQNIDYLSVDIPVGFTGHSGWKGGKAYKLYLAAVKFDDERSFREIGQNDFAAFIGMPSNLMRAMEENDKKPGNDILDRIEKSIK